MIRGGGRPDKYLTSEGTPVPSVTEILGKFKPSAALTSWAVKLAKEGKDHRAEAARAARWGAVVHDCIESFMSDSAEPSPKDTDDAALFESAVLAARAACSHVAIMSIKDEIAMVETPMVCDSMGFGGTFDAWTTSDCIIDWKTSGDVYPEYVLQMGAYHILCDSYLKRLDNPTKTRTAKIVKIGKKTVGDLICGTGEVSVVDIPADVLSSAGTTFARLVEFHKEYSGIEAFLKETKSDARPTRKRRK